MVHVCTNKEEVLLNNKVFFPAEGHSSTLIEATVVVSALVALYRWVERTPPQKHGCGQTAWELWLKYP